MANIINQYGQVKLGVRIPPLVSPLWNSVFGVWNADTLGTSLDTSIYGVYNGDNVNDTSGNARNGTNVNNVTFTTGKVGNAFTFNGSSNYVAFPNSSFDFTGEFSISTWVKIPSAPSAAGFIFHNGNYDVATSYGYGLRVNPNRTISFYISSTGGASTVTSTTTLALDTWYHVTVKRDSVAKRSDLYINGIFEVQETNVNITIGYGTRAIQPAIGAYRQNNQGVLSVSNYLNGQVDALTIWNKKLTEAEITSLYNTGTGAEYPFSSQTLPSPNDAVSTNHGTLMNGCTFATGKIGQAFTFDGVNDYVALPDNSLNFTGNFSYSFWIKSTNTSSFTAIISNIENARSPFGFSHGYWYRLNSGKIQASYRDGNNSTEFLTTSVGSVSNGSWNHVVITFNKTNSTTGVKIYINGNIDTTGIPPNTGGTALPIGYSSPMKACIGALYFNGAQSNFLPNGTSIDALSAWNKELTASEITELYNSGNGKQYPN